MPNETVLLPMGALAFFINERPHREPAFTEEEADRLAAELAKSLQAQLRKVDERLVVSSSFWRRGCVVVVVTISIAIPAVAGAAYAFVKDYDKLKNNIHLIADDVSKWFKPKDPRAETARNGGNPDAFGINPQYYRNVLIEPKPSHEYVVNEMEVRTDLIRWIEGDGGASKAHLASWLNDHGIKKSPTQWLRSKETPYKDLRAAFMDLEIGQPPSGQSRKGGR